MEEETTKATVDFVPAICFIPRGVAKGRPEKIVLTREELARVIQSTRESLESENSESEDQDIENDNMVVEDSEGDHARVEQDEFNFENYENESNAGVASISNIVDADHQIHDDDNDDDSEAEDDIIKETDNLLLVGHVQDDAASLEVWIFNEDEGSLYTHHDFLLPSYPLCIEWLNHDPGSDKSGNLCAIGCIDPIISIWDLDIQDLLEPTFKLGSKGSRRKNREKYGHTDAVLDLSWNKQFEHILASGSADKKLILWDLDEGMPHTSIEAFEDKVQSIEFHPDEAQSILAGSADGKVRLFDCREQENINHNYVKWGIPGEVEKVLWHPINTNNFIVGTNSGMLAFADKRKPDEFLWSVQAHDEEISGICFNNQIKELVTSTSIDGIMKVWKCNESELKQVYAHEFQLGRLLCMKQCPDDPFTLALGGDKSPRCRVYNIKNFEAVRKIFHIPEVLS